MIDQTMELSEKLSRLQWLMHKHHLRTHAENGPMADPTRGQGRIFAILKMQDGISTKDLSYLLGIRVSSLNELLAKMEKNGYLKREPSPTDKRIMLNWLTEKGRDETPQEWNPDAMFACLSAEEQAVFSGYLDRLIGAIEAELGEEADEDLRDWWTRGGRERMGNEMFDRFAAMRHGRPGPDDRPGPPPCGRERRWDGFPHDGRFPGRPDRPPAPPQGPSGPDEKG